MVFGPDENFAGVAVDVGLEPACGLDTYVKSRYRRVPIDPISGLINALDPKRLEIIWRSASADPDDDGQLRTIVCRWHAGRFTQGVEGLSGESILADLVVTSMNMRDEFVSTVRQDAPSPSPSSLIADSADPRTDTEQERGPGDDRADDIFVEDAA